MEEKENRRIKLTKVMLKNSLVELMQKAPVNKITIKEICENADINRSTFYVYYADQYALLDEIEDEIILKTTEYVEESDSAENEEELLETFLTYISENINVFRVLLCKERDYSFQKHLMDIVMQQFIEKRKSANKWDEGISEYIFRFTIMGSMSLIENWIDRSLDKSPKEMAEMILLLTTKGLTAYE